ncbi:MAG: type II methionyl aminopeptidase [Candidatus Diapherotrites archaeon]
MEKSEFEKYVKAGEILSQVKKDAAKSVKPGQKVLDVCERIENQILELKGKPAFPVNLSANENAAHDTAKVKDERVVGEKDLLKVDVGVQVDGFIADCAFTLDFSGEWEKLVEASELALQNALSVVKIGVETGKIGAEIENAIQSKGFHPIRNLSGHGLLEGQTHAEPTIPNYNDHSQTKLEEGMAFAIEPFACTGDGIVREGGTVEIFSLESPRPVRHPKARDVQDFVIENFELLPFAERWIDKELKLSEFDRKIALRELVQKEVLHSYPVLHERKGVFVAQSETSIVLFDGKVHILVK